MHIYQYWPSECYTKVSYPSDSDVCAAPSCEESPNHQVKSIYPQDGEST